MADCLPVEQETLFVLFNRGVERSMNDYYLYPSEYGRGNYCANPSCYRKHDLKRDLCWTCRRIEATKRHREALILQEEGL